jgi:hypothetical protein
VEDLFVQVDGEAAAGAGSRAAQGARAALLGAVAGSRLKAMQAQDRAHADGAAHGGNVDGRSSDIGVTLRLLSLAFVLSLA